MTEIRLSWKIPQSVTSGYSNIRLSYSLSQAGVDGFSKVRASWFAPQPLVDGYSAVRASEMVCQALFPVLPELPMSELPFPGFGNSPADPAVPLAKDPFNTPLPGLSYGVRKKPIFTTNTKTAASGAEVRTSLTPYPRWDFEFSYEFLEDRTGADSSLKTLMGFFLQMRGSYDTFLLKDPDDYLVEYGNCGDADGVTTQFPLIRNMGGFDEIVGQLDTANPLVVYHQKTEVHVIPVTPGPYTVTVDEALTFHLNVSVSIGATTLTKVNSAPGVDQYTETDGVYTFNSGRQGQTANIVYSYVVDEADYAVRAPNYIVFDSAPSTGVVYASFQFFFACRFIEDQLEFEKFYDQLWNLQTCGFRSVIQ